MIMITRIIAAIILIKCNSPPLIEIVLKGLNPRKRAGNNLGGKRCIPLPWVLLIN